MSSSANEVVLDTAPDNSNSASIIIDPSKLSHFGPGKDVNFYLVTNGARSALFGLSPNHNYKSASVVGLEDDHLLEDFIVNETVEPAHIFVVSQDKFLASPNPEVLGKRKLIVMPCASTVTSCDAIAHFLNVVERSDPAEETRFVDRFFDLGQRSKRLEYVNDEFSTVAIFDHLDDGYEWNVQAGSLDWGDQQIAPSGELSVCPGSIMEYKHNSFLEINGELVLSGPLAIHRGTPSFLEEDRMRLHRDLDTMSTNPIIVSIEHGRIVDVRATHEDSEIAVSALKALIEIDSRYAVLWECGFGINRNHTLFEGNIGMNEPFGGTHGCAHWGVGLTPYTQYALIVLAQGTRVIGDSGEHLIGHSNNTSDSKSENTKAKAGMGNVKNGPCGCYPT